MCLLVANEKSPALTGWGFFAFTVINLHFYLIFGNITELNKGDNMGDLSKHFSRSEFACQGENCCGNSSPVNMRLVGGLEYLRQLVGSPLVISSGFRCVKHNKDIGGATNSQHTYGTAVDVMCPKGISVSEFYELANEIPVFDCGGIGIYSNRLHLDVRVGKARWDSR